MKLDVLIIGGGLAGASLACALRGSHLKVGLADRYPPRVPEGWDPRVYAISPVNVEFLRRCGVWDLLDAARVAPVRRMDVAGDRGGRICFDAYESGLDALAWMVESGRLARELWETARRQPNVSLLSPVEPAALRVAADGAELTLADGRTLQAQLVVGADGVESWVRSQAGLAERTEPYHERGVVANFRSERPHHDTAFQWFRADGVLAYLPLPGNQISIVWSTADDHADALLRLSGDEFCARVAAAGAHRLGRLELVTPPAAFPLRLMRVGEVVAPRVALIGDAAHAVHPLSGHGINLGFRDASSLADLLLTATAGRDCGEPALLQRHARRRAEEVALVQTTTHGLHELFKIDSRPLAWVRNLGMNLTGSIPLVRSVLARYAAGFN